MDRTGTIEASDADLVAAFRAGDTSALAGIYDRHADALHSFAVRTLGSSHDAADVVQDAFVLAFRRMDQLRDPSRLRPWLYAIVRNECTRVGRARARVVPVSPGDHHDPEDRGSAAATQAMAAGGVGSGGTVDHDPVGTAAERAADVAVLHDALDGLDERDRALFALQADRGLSGRDLADAAGLPARQLGQATARMRDRLERSIVSLLVSRHGRRDCDELGRILSAWDGRLTVLLRKRVSRHIEDCDTCQVRRAALVLPVRSALAAPLVVIAAPADLRRRVLEQIGATGPAGTGSDTTSSAPGSPDATHEAWPGGFPPAAPPDPVAAGRRRTLVGMAAAVVVVVALATLWALQAGGAADDAVAGAPVASTTTTSPSPTSPAGIAPSDVVPTSPAAPQGPAPTSTTVPQSAEAPAPTGPPPAEVAPPSVDPPPADVTPADPGPDDVAPPPATPDPTPPDPPQPPTPRAPAPTVTSVSGPGALVWAGCPGPTTGRVTAAVTGSGLTVELLTEGIGSPASTPMSTDGTTWTAAVGPYDQPGTVIVRVRATDDQGRTATSEPVSFRVQRCAR